MNIGIKQELCVELCVVSHTLSDDITSWSRLRLRPHCGPPSLGPSYPEFPPLTSAGWPAGCRTPDPFSQHSSAEQETGSQVFRMRSAPDAWTAEPANHRQSKPPRLVTRVKAERFKAVSLQR